MSLSVKILTDSDFDALPYPEAKMSLGLADTKKGEAYVRYTASKELNNYLIEHELEHLLGEDRDEIHHGGDGVYYKGFGNIFQGLGQAFQGAGQSIFGGLQKVGESVSGAGRSIMGAFNPQQGQKPINVPMQGMAQNAGRLGPMTAMPSSGPSMQGYAPLSPRNKPSVAPIPLANPMNFFLGGGNKPNANLSPAINSSVNIPSPQVKAPQQTPASTSGLNIPMSSNAPVGTQTIYSSSGAPMSSINSSRLPGFQPPPMFTQTGPNVIQATRPGVPSMKPPMGMDSGAGASQATPSSGGLGNMLGKNPQQTLLGAGLEGIGQLGIQTPNMPDISELPSVQALRNFNFNSVGELDPALEQAINNDFQRIEDREYEAFVSRYKSLRPGADIESDSNFKRDLFELQRMQGSRRADAMAKYRFEMIRTNLQLSQAELAQLQDMAQMDLDMIMGQMGLDYADAQKFKDTFSRLGDTLINQGLGIGQGQEEEVSNA